MGRQPRAKKTEKPEKKADKPLNTIPISFTEHDHNHLLSFLNEVHARAKFSDLKIQEMEQILKSYRSSAMLLPKIKDHIFEIIE